jgi:short-subunit dehydrogenase
LLVYESVCIIYRNAERLEAAAKEIRVQLGPKVPEDIVFPIACDIRKEDQVSSTYSHIIYI